MGLKIEGFDKLLKELTEIEETVEKYNGTQVSFGDLFTSEFMGAHTEFSSFDEWMSAGHFKFENQEEFDAIPTPILDRYVKHSTDFITWQDMLDEAGQIFLTCQLGWD